MQYSKFQMAKASLWQPTMDKCKANARSTTNEFATVVAGKFMYAKVKHNTKQKALFLFLVMWTVRFNQKLLLAYAQPLEQLQLLQYSKLQMAKTVVKASFVQVYNTYIPYDSQLCMGKYKACTWICYKNREVYVYKVKSGYGIGVKPSTIVTTWSRLIKKVGQCTRSRITTQEVILTE